jgi:preprotein translocase subunit SecA
VVGFRGYAQRDPLNEYKTEAFSLFETLLNDLRRQVTMNLSRVEVRQAPPETPAFDDRALSAHHADPATGLDEEPTAPATAFAATPVARDSDDPSTWGHVGRNEPCPCGSGKKFKHCHGQFA